MKTLLTGKQYVPAVETDLKRTFARVRREQKEEAKEQLARDDEAARERQKLDAKVTQILRGKA